MRTHRTARQRLSSAGPTDRLAVPVDRDRSVADRHAASSSKSEEGVHAGEIPQRGLVGPAIHRRGVRSGGKASMRVRPRIAGYSRVGRGRPRPAPRPPGGSRCRYAARPTAGSGRWTAPPWGCTWAGEADSRSVDGQRDQPQRQLGGAGRGGCHRDSRCRRARGRGGPSGRRRGGTSLDIALSGDVFPAAVGGKLRWPGWPPRPHR